MAPVTLLTREDRDYSSYLARDPSVVSAALPEPPAVTSDVAHQLLLVREVHLPDQGAVTEHPHDDRRQFTPAISYAGRQRPMWAESNSTAVIKTPPIVMSVQ